MTSKTGRFAILDQFILDGVTHMFGNPGTVEQGFLNALDNYPKLKYVLTLQETVAVLMADGYARATLRPTVVQLHSSPGIGNAVGALYQAKRGHAPLVVIGGDAGIRYMNMDAQMANDLVAMMEPVTKYATVVMHPDSVLRTLRRAVKIAATPPMGPVYVCLPQDILDQVNQEMVFPTCMPNTRVCPDESFIDEVADRLLEARQPMIYIGDGVAHSGATAELTRLAENLGAEVYGVDTGDLCMDFAHPLYQGTTGHMFGEHSLPITQKGDVNLVVGTYMLPEVFPCLGDIYRGDAQVIHLDLNAYEIAKNHRVDLAAVCDPKLSLGRLGEVIEKRLTAEQRTRARSRIDELAQEKETRLQRERAEDEKRRGSTPLHMSEFAHTLADKLPRDTVIFDEALTNSPELVRYLDIRKPGSYFVTRGGSLGVGIPGAIGIKIAHPEQTVIGFTGDGGSMYTMQALWSAARHNVGAKFVVCNNGSYRLLQLNITAYWKSIGENPMDYPTCFDLSEPPIRFDRLAQAMGVGALRVERPDEIEAAVDKMLEDDKPFLIDLVLEGDVHPEQVGVKCGQ